MNIFRSLIGKVWQDPNAAEVVKISTGQLHLVRPGNIRTPKECIYNEAMATIRRVPSMEHTFQLVITRVYEDGDQELLEDEDETDEERVFLITQELNFRTGETEGEPNFVFRDLQGDVDEFYEFIATGMNEPTRAFFETCMYRAMYERKYNTSADNTQDSDFEEFIWRPPPEKKAASKGKGPALSKPAAAIKPAPGPEGTTASLFAHKAVLWFWSQKQFKFTSPIKVKAEISKQSTSGYKYWLVASTDEGTVLAHEVSSEMNHKCTNSDLAITWNHGGDGKMNSWCISFKSGNPEQEARDSEAYSGFLDVFARALWESRNQSMWDKLKRDEQDYMRSSLEDIEMLDPEGDNDSENKSEEDEEEFLSDLEEEEEEANEEEDDEDEEGPSPLPNERNSQLTVGYKGDRSYVVRGSSIGVFRHANNEKVKYYATISKIATPKGKGFKPKQVMLHDQDTKMILMNPGAPNSLYSMDIEQGKVVEEWRVHDDISVDNITPETKFAQTTHEQTLVGTSHNALFRIDPRISGNKLVDSQFKQYVSKNAFSAVTTTAAGKLAVASEKGDIRLFDSIGKNAKTALPPLGDPITGIDVTADGRWIVATTKTYLLLIDTLIGEGRYKGNLGFDRSFPASSKPMPRRLHLRSEHVAYMNHDINFTPARFNQGGKEENAIVTSSGQFVIAWDFAKVKKGQFDKYEIKRYTDEVVQDNFKFGDDKQIIVALQNDVLAVNKNELKKPTRSSLGGQLQSRSDIVNSPY